MKDRLAREGVEMVVPADGGEPADTASTSDEQQQCESEPPRKRRKLGSWLKASKQQHARTIKVCSKNTQSQSQRRS